jgi:hypothetical protein
MYRSFERRVYKTTMLLFLDDNGGVVSLGWRGSMVRPLVEGERRLAASGLPGGDELEGNAHGG